MMHIGIVSTWLNRGQATVSRYLRSILDELGHKTFVLARPTRDNDALPKFIAKSDVWEQEGVTHASNFVIPLKEIQVNDAGASVCPNLPGILKGFTKCDFRNAITTYLNRS